jgi:hypothetical protein
MLMVRRANMGAFHSSRRGKSEAANGQICLGIQVGRMKIAPCAGNTLVADSFRDTNLLINGEKFMNTKPMAEAYEKAKELRRQGEPVAEISHKFEILAVIKKIEVHVTYRPQSFREAFVGFMRKFTVAAVEESTNWVRTLDIKTLADRVFGDEEKAEAWLRRPNASLSGQRPIDLLKDELGANVVREQLERIDHGIFA